MSATGEVVEVLLSDLRLGFSPRTVGVDHDHAYRLREVLDLCPPILVQAGTNKVIDGRHRWSAAAGLKRTSIRAVVVDLADEDAAARAIAENNAHGLPLTLADRKSAARKIIVAGSTWSDSRIAEVCGLNNKTVADMRPRPTKENAKLDSRVGKDQKSRPTDPGSRREVAAKLIIAKPDASLREVAEATGLSPTTVADVRKRVEADEPVVPPKLTAVPSPPPGVRVADVLVVIPKWTEDDACLRTAEGRAFASWFGRIVTATEKALDHVDGVPAEHVELVTRMARHNAEIWNQFANRLRRRGEIRSMK